MPRARCHKHTGPPRDLGREARSDGASAGVGEGTGSRDGAGVGEGAGLLSLGVRGSRESREVAGSDSALEGPASRRRRKDLAGEKIGGRPGGRSQKDTETPRQASPRVLTEFPQPGVSHLSIRPSFQPPNQHCSDEPGTVPAAGVKTAEQRVGSLFSWSLQHSSWKRGTMESYCQSHEDSGFPELRDQWGSRGPDTEPRHKGGNG